MSAWSGQVLGPLAGGARSRLWRVAVAGRACVARPSSDSETSLRWLTGAQAALRRAGIEAPALLPAQNGALSAGGFTVEPWLDGRPGTMANLAALGPALRRWHRMTRGLPDRPGHPPLARLAVGLPPALAAAVRAVLPGAAAGAMHGDLHPGNLIRLPTGRLALVDWEEARRDLLVLDLPAGPLHLAYEVAAGWRHEPARARRLTRLLALELHRCRWT